MYEACLPTQIERDSSVKRIAVFLGRARCTDAINKRLLQSCMGALNTPIP